MNGTFYYYFYFPSLSIIVTLFNLKKPPLCSSIIHWLIYLTTVYWPPTTCAHVIGLEIKMTVPAKNSRLTQIIQRQSVNSKAVDDASHLVFSDDKIFKSCFANCKKHGTSEKVRTINVELGFLCLEPPTKNVRFPRQKV